MDRAKHRSPHHVRVVACILAASLSVGCAGKAIHIVVAQSALGMVQAVGNLQLAAEQLHRAGSLTTPQAIAVQSRLLDVNQKIVMLLPTLQAFDRVQQAGGKLSGAEVDLVLQLIIAISNELSLVVAGVPVAETTKQLLELIRTAQQSVSVTLVEVAKLRAVLES